MIKIALALSIILSYGNASSISPDHLFLDYIDKIINSLNLTLSSPEVMDSLSINCFHHMEQLIFHGQNRTPWALKMLDSYGKPGSGLMQASFQFLGMFSECTKVEAIIPSDGELEGKESIFKGKYCLMNVAPSSSSLDEFSKLTGLSPDLLSTTQPRIGICSPTTCSSKDIKLMVTTAVGSILENTTISFYGCSKENEPITKDTGALIMISVFILFMVPILIGTLLEMFTNKVNDTIEMARTRRQTSVQSLTSSIDSPLPRNLKKKESKMKEFFKCFSLISNVKKIFSTEQKTTANHIQCLNGLRVLMMMWIITGHTYSFGMQWLFFQNPVDMKTAPQSFMSQIFANGTFSVDTFLFISGLLVTNLCMKELRKSRGKFNIVMYYVHRYLRMTPLMMAIIGFTANLLKYMGSGPAFQESTLMYDGWCKKNWWLNSLYLQNFVDRENMCLSHTWYSAVDMQLYFFAPLILIPMYHRPKLAFGFMGFILAGSTTLVAYLTLANHLPAIPYMSNISTAEEMNDYYGMVYIKPYTRVGPYIVGMAVGFLLYSLDGKICLNRKQSVFGWTMAILSNIFILMAMLPANMGIKPSDAMAAAYSATARTIWALSLGWITFACSAGKGGFIGTFLSARFWVPWSRLTYAAYLIHPVVMAIFYGTRGEQFEFSFFLMSYIAIGNMVITYVVSILLSVVFESPIVAIEKFVIGESDRHRSGSNTHVLSSSPTP